MEISNLVQVITTADGHWFHIVLNDGRPEFLVETKLTAQGTPKTTPEQRLQQFLLQVGPRPGD